MVTYLRALEVGRRLGRGCIMAVLALCVIAGHISDSSEARAEGTSERSYSLAASKPGKPARPTVTSGDGKLTVSWTAPSDGGSAILDYDIGYKPAGGFWQTTSSGSNLLARTPGTSYQMDLTRVSNGVQYEVRVRALNGIDFGPWSDVATQTPKGPPEAPGAPSVVAGSASLAVSWSKPNDGGEPITDYDVEYRVGDANSGTRWVEWQPGVQSTARSTTITGLTPGDTHPVQVRARNSLGTSPWSSVTFATVGGAAPGMPSGLAVSTGNGSLTVSWTAPSDGGSPITGYQVWARALDGSYERTRNTGNTTGATITGLTNGKTYNVAVRAENSIGWGYWSLQTSGTPVASVPGKVGRPTVTPGDRSLTVSWSAPGDGGSAITGYDVLYRPQGGSQSQSRRVRGATSVTISGVTNGVVYDVSVRARNSVGAGSWSDRTSATPQSSATRPDPIRQISVTPGDRSLTVSWSAPGDGGSTITGYEVSYIESQYVGCADCGVVADVITTTSLRATISGLTNGTSYTVYVRARNSVGVGLWVTNASGTPVSSATVPGKVGRPSVTVGDGSLTVSWSAPSNGGSAITGYEVWYSPDTSSQSWTRTTSSTSATLSGLTNGTSYTIYVRAQNAQGFGSWSDAASGTPVSSATRPGIVSQPSITAGDGSLTVSWNAPSNGGSTITDYDVRYIQTTYVGCGDCGVSPTRLTTTSRQVRITGLTNGTSYTVSVRAKNSVGSGLWSSNASGTPVTAATVPGKVGQLSITAGDGSLTVSWNAPSDGGSTITDYDVRYSSSATGDTWTRSTTSTSVTLSNLTNGTSYRVNVQANNSQGQGSWSNAAWGTPVAAATVPAKVGLPSVTAGDGSLTVSWGPPSDGGSTITDYDVRYIESSYIGCADCGALPWVDWQSSTVSTTPWTRITGLANGTNYAVVVRAKNSVGTGPWSDDGQGTPVTAASVPRQPALPTVVAGDGSVTVSWSPPDDSGSAITGYDVWYRPSTSSGSYTELHTTATSIRISNLTNGTSYRLFVRAENSAGEGAWSEGVWATPTSEASLPARPAAPSVVAGDRSLTVSWSPPADGGSAITLYEVWYRPDTSSQYRTHRTTETTATLWSLTNGTSYTIFVRAQNVQGFSEWSPRASGTPREIKAPSKPTIALRQRADTVHLTWRVNDDGGTPIVDYDVYYRQSLRFDSDFSVTRPDFQRMDKSDGCLLLAEVTTSFVATPPTATGRITLDHGLDLESLCYSSLGDQVFRTFEFRIMVRNSAGRSSWSPSHRVTLMPWQPPQRIPKIDYLTVQRHSAFHPSSWRARAVFLDFDPVDHASHYEVEWKIDGKESGSAKFHDSHTGRGNGIARRVRINDVWKADRELHFRLLASNAQGETASEWKPLLDARVSIAKGCQRIDPRDADSPDMLDIVDTVVKHTPAWVAEGVAGQTLGTLLRGLKRASWADAALALIEKLDRCYYNLDYFLRELPVIGEIIDGYTTNQYTAVSVCGGSLDLEEFLECFT